MRLRPFDVNAARATYAARRVLRTPRMILFRRLTRDADPATRQVYEHASYSRALFAFERATLQNPDLVIDFDLDEASVVVDGGAFIGNWSVRVAKRFGSRIYAFEPNPAALPALRKRTSPFPNISVQHYGLGARNETLSMSDAGIGASFFSENYFAKKLAVETVSGQIRDVAEVFAELQLDHVDLLALNIEGGEYEVLPRLAETGWIPRIDAILVQFHEWLPRARRSRRSIQQTLRRTHTQLWEYPWVFEAWRRSGIS